MITASIFSVLENRHLSKTVPPLMVQVALGGLIPFYILKAPNYPLLHLNMLVYASMTVINMLFLVRNILQFFGLFLIKVIFMALLYVYNQQKMADNNTLANMGLNDKPRQYALLVPDTLSPGYLVHFFFVMVFCFWLIALAAMNLFTAKHAMNELAKT